jgi:hypothetical protein
MLQLPPLEQLLHVVHDALPFRAPVARAGYRLIGVVGRIGLRKRVGSMQAVHRQGGVKQISMTPSLLISMRVTYRSGFPAFAIIK